MRKFRGFTLIETAMVMMIAGLMLSGALRVYTTYLKREKIVLTKKRLDDARLALAGFVALNKRLPCPASPEAFAKGKLKDKNSGNAVSEAGDICTSDAPPAHDVILFRGSGDVKSDKEVWIGVLPVRELRLNAEQAQDGWGNLITYAVSRRLTLQDGMVRTPPGIIEILDEFGNSIVDPPQTGRFVLVSHGATGRGAWTTGGGRSPCDLKAGDAANCDGDASFRIAPYSTAEGAHFFDDFVTHDGADAGGSPVERILTCNMKKKFYVPGEPGADDDGCAVPRHLWQGACLLSSTVGDDGLFHDRIPLPISPPAVADGLKCGCAEGLTVVNVGSWDDGARTPLPGDQGSWTTTGNQVAGAGPLQVQSSGTRPPSNTRTALYTCMQ